MTGVRLDIEMVNRGMVSSRERAKAMIMAGEVTVNGQRNCKAGHEIKTEDKIAILSNPIPFVSRGGLKLAKAIKVFSIDLTNKKCIDVGASTGGFTDCMLQNGAKHVHAVDVGYGQLDWKLRNSPAVTVMERTNARYMVPEWYPWLFEFASIDVSFISLKLILPPLFSCLCEEGEAVALIKPQFEAERSEIGKKGVVKDKAIHKKVCISCMQMAVSYGFKILGLSFSPIKGPEGNIEFLMHLKKMTDPDERLLPDFTKIAEEAASEAHINSF